MNGSTQQQAETRIVSLQPGMYIVRFREMPVPGESAILSVAPAGGGGLLDFFCSEGVQNNTLLNQSDVVIVRCTGGDGNLLITSMCQAAKAVGARIERIAGAAERPAADVVDFGGPQAVAPPEFQAVGQAPQQSSFPQPQQWGATQATLAGTSQIAGFGGAEQPLAQNQPFQPQPAPQQQSTGLPPLNLTGHIEQQGDVLGQPGAWLGDPQSSRRLEGFAIQWPGKPQDVDIAYSCVIGGLGRSPAVLSGGFCGSRQRAAPITALSCSLVGKNAATYELRTEAVFAGCPPQKLRSGVEVRGITGREPLVALKVSINR